MTIAQHGTGRTEAGFSRQRRSLVRQGSAAPRRSRVLLESRPRSVIGIVIAGGVATGWFLGGLGGGLGPVGFGVAAAAAAESDASTLGCRPISPAGGPGVGAASSVRSSTTSTTLPSTTSAMLTSTVSGAPASIIRATASPEQASPDPSSIGPFSFEPFPVEPRPTDPLSLEAPIGMPGPLLFHVGDGTPPLAPLPEAIPGPRLLYVGTPPPTPEPQPLPSPPPSVPPRTESEPTPERETVAEPDPVTEPERRPELGPWHPSIDPSADPGRRFCLHQLPRDDTSTDG